MRHLLLAGAIALTAAASSAAQAQQGAEFSTSPITVTFVNSRLEDALKFIARSADVTIEFDASVTEEMRQAPLSQQPIKMVGVTIEAALAAITTQNGLTYTVIGPKALRIARKV